MAHESSTSGVIYQIYPLSFAGTEPTSPTGTINGITDRLDYIASLGADIVWMSPIFESPLVDHGYDVSDYRKIDPRFGTLEDFDRMVAEAHERGLKICLDFVLNHCSDQHEWFKKAIEDPTSPERDFFFWGRTRKGPDGTIQPPTNQLAQFGDPLDLPSAWSRDPSGQTHEMYLHTFQPAQPDLDWNNPELRRRMHDNLRFWLERGIDGARFDVIHLIGKPPVEDLEDLPDGLRDGVVGNWNRPDLAVPRLKEIRELFESYGASILIGEVNLDSPELQGPYQKDGALSSTFLMFGMKAANRNLRSIATTIQARIEHFTDDMAPTWVIDNHDWPRSCSPERLGSVANSIAMTVFMLSLGDSCVIYQGQELGTNDVQKPLDWDYTANGHFRDGPRGRMAWTADAPNHGWPELAPGVEHVFEMSPNSEQYNVESEISDPMSPFSIVRDAIAYWKQTARSQADLESATATDEVVRFARGGLEIAVNLGETHAAIPNVDENELRMVELASNDRVGLPLLGGIDPHTCAITRTASEQEVTAALCSGIVDGRVNADDVVRLFTSPAGEQLDPAVALKLDEHPTFRIAAALVHATRGNLAAVSSSLTTLDGSVVEAGFTANAAERLFETLMLSSDPRAKVLARRARDFANTATVLASQDGRTQPSPVDH